MMKKMSVCGALAVATCFAVSCQIADPNVNGPATAPGAAPLKPVVARSTIVPPPLPPGAKINGVKDAYAGKFLIGTCGDMGNNYSATDRANMKANYNIVT